MMAEQREALWAVQSAVEKDTPLAVRWESSTAELVTWMAVQKEYSLDSQRVAW